MNTRSIFCSFLFLSCFMFSCTPDTTLEEPLDSWQNTPLADDCEPEVICTEIFAAVSATLKYPDNSPVRLDSYEVIEVATGSNKTPENNPSEWEMYRNMGVYPITNDNYQKELVNQNREVEFIGYKAGKELIRRTFTVSADCCHVTHVAGDLEIILEK